MAKNTLPKVSTTQTGGIRSTFTFHLPDDLRIELQHFCIDHRLSVSELVRQLIRERLDSHSKHACAECGKAGKQ